MPSPQFEDVHPGFTASGYVATNEEPMLYELLLGRRPYKRTGGICSSGEVPLTVLLPRSEEVICIDHSYRSLAITYLKALLLDRLGTRSLKALFIEQTYEHFRTVIEPIATDMPEVLRPHLTDNAYYSTKVAPAIKALPRESWNEMRREWFYIRPAVLERARKNLHKLKLVHGDLKDLKAYGPFDCLYVSNCVDHANRDKKHPSFKDFEPLVAEGGHMLMAGYVPTPGNHQLFDPQVWQDVKMLRGARTSWEHHLLRKKPVKAVGATATVSPLIP